MIIGFPVWLINDTIKRIFIWSILIIFGDFRKKLETPNSMCTDKKSYF